MYHSILSLPRRASLLVPLLLPLDLSACLQTKFCPLLSRGVFCLAKNCYVKSSTNHKSLLMKKNKVNWIGMHSVGHNYVAML